MPSQHQNHAVELQDMHEEFPTGQRQSCSFVESKNNGLAQIALCMA